MGINQTLFLLSAIETNISGGTLGLIGGIASGIAAIIAQIAIIITQSKKDNAEIKKHQGDTTEKMISIAIGLLEPVNEQLMEREKENKELRAESRELREHTKCLEAKMYELEREIIAVNSQLKEAQELSDVRKLTIERLNLQVEELKHMVENKDKTILTLQTEVNELREEVNEYRKLVEEYKIPAVRKPRKKKSDDIE